MYLTDILLKNIGSGLYFVCMYNLQKERHVMKAREFNAVLPRNAIFTSIIIRGIPSVATATGSVLLAFSWFPRNLSYACPFLSSAFNSRASNYLLTFLTNNDIYFFDSCHFCHSALSRHFENGGHHGYSKGM